MNKSKLIKYYLINFLMSIVLLLTILSLVIRFTVLSPKYIESKIKNSNFIELLHNDLKENIDENLMSTGFKQEIIEELYSNNILENETEKLINSLNGNGSYEFSTSNFEENLKNNINEFLKEKNEKVEQSEINNFIKEMTKVYKNNMVLYNYMPKFINYYNLLKLLTTIFYVGGIIILATYIFIKRKELSKYISIPLYFASFSLIFFYFYINLNFDIANFSFYSNSISILIKEILRNIMNITLISGIIFFILGILININEK